MFRYLTPLVFLSTPFNSLASFVSVDGCKRELLKERTKGIKIPFKFQLYFGAFIRLLRSEEYLSELFENPNKVLKCTIRFRLLIRPKSVFFYHACFGGVGSLPADTICPWSPGTWQTGSQPYLQSSRKRSFQSEGYWSKVEFLFCAGTVLLPVGGFWQFLCCLFILFYLFYFYFYFSNHCRSLCHILKNK